MMAAPGQGRRNVLHPSIPLWAAFLAPFLAWFGQLNLNFLVAAFACEHGRNWILHIFFASALAVAAVGIWCGWRHYRILSPEERQGTRFLYLLAMSMGGFFVLGILVNQAPLILAEPCR